MQPDKSKPPYSCIRKMPPYEQTRYHVQWSESLIAITRHDGLKTLDNFRTELQHFAVVPKSFVSSVPIELSSFNGIITVPKGTPLNYDVLGTGVPNAVKITVRYAYRR